MVDYHGIPLEIPWIMTFTITIHDMYGDDVILQFWLITKKLW